MSLFLPLNVMCPSCEEVVRVNAVGSVNADRRPDLREAILADHFQETTCEACNETFRLQPDFNYLDAGRGQWIAAMAAHGFPEYLVFEDKVTALFETSYGAASPAAAQAVGRNLDVRLTFGWPAVREKLLARSHEIEDVTLEVMKLDMLRKLPSVPLEPGVELRLLDVRESEMVFSWIRTLNEETLEQFAAPLSWYRSILDAPEPWEAVRAKVTDGPFVDMQKVYMGEGRTAAE